MRKGLEVLTAVVLAAGVAACNGGDDDVELYEGEEAATPSLETPAQPTQPAAGMPLMTAQFETAETAPEGAQITGTVRIFQADDAAAMGAGTTDQTATDQTATDQAATDEAATDQTDMSATTMNEGDAFRVEVSVNGLEQGEHAWHIHSGPCGEQAPVVVAFSPTSDMEGLTDALNADQSGRAEGSATVPADQLTLDRLQGGEYSLHVHTQGGVDHGPTVACADLDGAGTTTTM